MTDEQRSHRLPTNARETLLRVSALAEYLDVTQAWVYAHAEELGAIRLGSGPKAPLRFNLGVVLDRLSPCAVDRKSVAPEVRETRPSRKRRGRAMGTNVVLLPIRGAKGAG